MVRMSAEYEQIADPDCTEMAFAAYLVFESCIFVFSISITKIAQ